jgi:hypothetical protein
VTVERFMNIRETAQRLGVSDTAVRFMVARGALAVAARTTRGICLFRTSDVERLVGTRTARPAPAPGVPGGVVRTPGDRDRNEPGTE